MKIIWARIKRFFYCLRFSKQSITVFDKDETIVLIGAGKYVGVDFLVQKVFYKSREADEILKYAPHLKLQDNA